MRRKHLPKRHWNPEHWWREWARRSAEKNDLVRTFVSNGVRAFREQIDQVDRAIRKSEPDV